MPWWSWLVIWTILVLGLFAMLGWLGFRLFRKMMGTLEALGELADKASVLESRVDELTPERFNPAVFEDAGELSQRRQEKLADRRRARQARRDKRLDQAKLLVSADPQRFSHLLKRM